MKILLYWVAALVTVPALAACAQTPGEITRDSKAFDGVAETASISLLGNEPFWGISIEPAAGGFSANYSSPDNIDGTQFSVTRFAGNNGLSFSGELDGETVVMLLTPNDCSDTMSARSYPYSATVDIGDRTLYGCGYTSDQPFTGDETP